MSFVKLTRDDGSDRSIDIHPDAITAVEQEVVFGNGTVLSAIVHMHGTCFQVKETREAILAAIADAAGRAVDEVTDTMLAAAENAWSATDATDLRILLTLCITAALRARGQA